MAQKPAFIVQFNWAIPSIFKQKTIMPTAYGFSSL